MKKKYFILELSLLLQSMALGLFALIFETPIGSFLFLSLDISERLAYGIDDFLGLVLILVSIALFFWKRLPFFLYMTLCFLAFAIFQTINGGVANSNLTLFAHSIRYLSPLGLYLILKGSGYGVWLLRVGISITFFTHGVEALLKEPIFVDYLINALSITQNTAGYFLYAIGIMDISLSIISLVVKRPSIYFYMAFWGGLTAFYRVLFEGEIGVLSMLMRISHFFIPLFLGLFILKKYGTRTQGSL